MLETTTQARQKWGEHAASAIWDASIVKVFMGGSSAPKDLADLSALIGEHDEFVDSTTWNGDGSRSHQRSVRRVPVMPTEEARMLPFGTALILLRSAPPIVADLRSWTAEGSVHSAMHCRTQRHPGPQNLRVKTS